MVKLSIKIILMSLIVLLFLSSQSQTALSFSDKYSSIGEYTNEEYWGLTSVGSYSDGEGTGDKVIIDGDLAYLSDREAGILILDISDPTNPTKIGAFYDGGDSREIVLRDNLLYVADYTDGLEIINVTDPTAPEKIGQYNQTDYLAVGLTIVGDYAYVAFNLDGLLIIDISDPYNPVKLGQHYSGQTHGIAVKGNYAYMVGYNMVGVVVIDISDPTNPGRVTTLATGGNAWQMVIAGDYLYIADNYLGLEIIDITSLAAPEKVKSYDFGGESYGIAVDGNYAYMADAITGLTVIDITDTESLKVHTEVAGLLKYGVAVNDDFVYLAGDSGLEILKREIRYEPTQPTNLQVIDQYPLVNLTWGAPEDDGKSTITSYTIYRGLSFDYLDFLIEVPSSPRIYLDENIAIGKTYFYAIKAENAAGIGKLSNIVNVTIGASSTTETTPAVDFYTISIGIMVVMYVNTRKKLCK